MTERPGRPVVPVLTVPGFANLADLWKAIVSTGTVVLRNGAQTYTLVVQSSRAGAHHRPGKVCRIDGFVLMDETDGHGQLRTRCQGCERRAEGRCMDCGRTVEGRAWRCANCKGEHQRQVWRNADQRYRLSRRARQRQYYQRPGVRERRLKQKKEWRKTNRKRAA